MKLESTRLSESLTQDPEPFGVVGLHAPPQLPAAKEHVPEQWLCQGHGLDPWEVCREMVLQQVFE